MPHALQNARGGCFWTTTSKFPLWAPFPISRQRLRSVLNLSALGFLIFSMSYSSRPMAASDMSHSSAPPATLEEFVPEAFLDYRLSACHFFQANRPNGLKIRWHEKSAATCPALAIQSLERSVLDETQPDYYRAGALVLLHKYARAGTQELISRIIPKPGSLLERVMGEISAGNNVVYLLCDWHVSIVGIDPRGRVRLGGEE